MPIKVTPSGKRELTKISCAECGERVRGIGLEKESLISGLHFKCKRCGRFNEVSAVKTQK